MLSVTSQPVHELIHEGRPRANQHGRRPGLVNGTRVLLAAQPQTQRLVPMPSLPAIDFSATFQAEGNARKRSCRAGDRCWG
jgi:hypothetical protein